MKVEETTDPTEVNRLLDQLQERNLEQHVKREAKMEIETQDATEGLENTHGFLGVFFFYSSY